MTLKDMFYPTAKAWDQLTPKTVDNCWSHVLKLVFSDPPAADVHQTEDSHPDS